MSDKVRGHKLKQGMTVFIDRVPHKLTSDASILIRNSFYVGVMATAEWTARDGAKLTGPVRIDPTKRYRVAARP